MATIKEVFENGNWIITKIMQGYDNQVRIDAKRRFQEADKSSFFSKWASAKYCERLASENYGKKLSEFKNYQY